MFIRCLYIPLYLKWVYLYFERAPIYQLSLHIFMHCITWWEPWLPKISIVWLVSHACYLSLYYIIVILICNNFLWLNVLDNKIQPYSVLQPHLSVCSSVNTHSVATCTYVLLVLRLQSCLSCVDMSTCDFIHT